MNEAKKKVGNLYTNEEKQLRQLIELLDARVSRLEMASQSAPTPKREVWRLIHKRSGEPWATYNNLADALSRLNERQSPEKWEIVHMREV